MKPVNVSPDISNPTHHVSLSDGKITIGLIARDSNGKVTAQAIRRDPIQRTAMKTTTGDVKYSDMNWPWMVIAQSDWSGGRGLDDAEKDQTRFYDSFRANTIFGKIFHAPQEVYTSGYRKQHMHMPGSVHWLKMITGQTRYLAARVITSQDMNASEIQLLVRRRGQPNPLTVELRSTTLDNPGSVLQSATISASDLSDILSEIRKVTFTAQSLTSGVSYWVVVYSSSGDDEDNHWDIGVEKAASNNKQSSNGTAWEASNYSLYYRITEAKQDARTMFFSYRYAQYMVRQVGTSAPQVYINGDRGMAVANTGNLNKLIDTAKSWTTDEFAGCIVVIVGGKGLNEEQNWRVISSNTATELIVTQDWVIEHDTTTEYVIVGANHWREITSTGLTSVKDILVINDIVYFAQGDDVNIRRMRWNTSTKSHEWADDGTNKASFLAHVRHTAGLSIWKANNKDASGVISVAKASVVNWGTNLTFGTALTMKDDYGRINRIIEYGDDDKQLWILREGMVFKTLQNSSGADILDKINLEELKTVMDFSNGKAAAVHNVYLLFSLGAGIEKYYDRNLDDIGANRDEGLPSERNGVCSDLLGYPGSFMAAYDAGENGYSSVLVQSGGGAPGSGWHELYRAPKGDRIWDIHFQTIPGEKPDRLWVAAGDDVLWLYMPSRTLNPTKDTQYRYTHEASVVSPWIYGGLADIWKLFNSIKIIADNLSSGQYIEMDYTYDDESEWYTISGKFDTSPDKEISINDDFGINAKRFRWRIRSQTNDNSKTPYIKSVILEAIGLITVKYGFQIPYRLEDQDRNLLGELDEYSGTEKQDIIDQWASTLTPLYMRSVRRKLDKKFVFVDPTPLAIAADHAETYTGSILVVER